LKRVKDAARARAADRRRSVAWMCGRSSPRARPSKEERRAMQSDRGHVGARVTRRSAGPGVRGAAPRPGAVRAGLDASHADADPALGAGGCGTARPNLCGRGHRAVRHDSGLRGLRSSPRQLEGAAGLARGRASPRRCGHGRSRLHLGRLHRPTVSVLATSREGLAIAGWGPDGAPRRSLWPRTDGSPLPSRQGRCGSCRMASCWQHRSCG
jgi:hypothetical protein